MSWIDELRTILDLESLARRLKHSGSAHIAAIGTADFIEKARKVVNLKEVMDMELRLQYRQFLKKIELYVEDLEMEKLDSMELFKAVLSTKNKIYEDVETIIHIICVPL